MDVQRKAIGVTLVGGLGVLFVLSFWPTPQPPAMNQAFAQQRSENPAVQEQLIAGAEQLSSVFRSAAKAVKPSVVRIDAMVKRRPRVQMNQFRFPFGLDDLQSEDPIEEADGQTEFESAGVGSGVIVSADGYILTNNHVVQSADEIEVQLYDGRRMTGKVVGTDDRSDVAVVKIDAKDIVPAKLGDSSLMDVGDWVIAVGSPFELDQTVTAGIISALNRSVAILPYEDFLQTDAAINPGNSGGPLVNLRGEVIGINTAINSRTGSNAGVGFAIPSSMAKQIMDGILTNGRVVRGFIGAVLGDLANNPEIASKLPGSYRNGAIIESVSKNDPADKAGLKAGDVIVKIDGKPLRDGRALKTRVALTPVGQVIKMTALRDGKEVEIGVRIEEQTDAKMNRLSGIVEIEEWGMDLVTLSRGLAEQLRIDPRLSGVLIYKVAEEGKAADFGLQRGDIIRKINNRDVTKPEEVLSAIRGGKALRIILRRGNQNAVLDVAPSCPSAHLPVCLLIFWSDHRTKD